MKLRTYIAIMAIAVFGLGLVSPVGALVVSPNSVNITLETANATQSQGASFTVDVKVSDVDYQNSAGKKAKVAASALTLTYDTAVLEVLNGGGELNRMTDVLSDLFGFVEDTRDNPGTPENDYARIGNDKSAEGKLMLSGANAGDSTKTGTQNLFQVKFRVKTTAALAATGNITLARTVPPADANTGWDGTASVDPLVGVLESWSDTSDVLDDFQVIPYVFGPALTITVSDFVDLDGDGISDAWETDNFGDLTTANQFTDYDMDGYLDITEYQNGTNPKVVDGQGGAGYDNRTDLRVYSADIDGNGGPADGATDGILAARYLFGFSDPDLTSGALGANCTRCTEATIKPYIDANLNLDIDGNGVVDGATDGILLARRLFGFGGPDLINGAVGANCARCTAPEIENFVDKIGFQK